MKKQCKILILLLLVSFLFTGNLFAQPNFDNPILKMPSSNPYRAVLDSILNQAPYVFEGRVVRGASGNFDEVGFGTYSFLFEVEKVYRGGEHVKAGTVEIVTRRNFDPSVRFYEGQWYLLFCKESDVEGVFDANNELTFELFYNVFSGNESRHSSYFGGGREGDIYRFTHFLDFQTKEKLMTFLENYRLYPQTPEPVQEIKTYTKKEQEEIKTKQQLMQFDGKGRTDEGSELLP
jgi:hypothetical protein